MAQEVVIRKVAHEIYGELYQFLAVDAEAGTQEAVDPYEAGLLQRAAPLEPTPELLYITSKRGAEAEGYYKGERFVVKLGSKFAASTSPKCPKKYVRLREELLLSKLLIPLHGRLLVMEDIEFDSPMSAMGAAIGGWVRGTHDWKKLKKK
ncbi:MAG TPA: methionine sulfoxide reductase [Planococcus sp. (in: firmicutes)]|nr:methionine sulfoxide reductase [Planococcus sp. (in: firmicutes)]